jgi:hypothetical protein
MTMIDYTSYHDDLGAADGGHPPDDPALGDSEGDGAAHQELFSTLAAQGVAPTGPWFSHHFRMDPATFDFEVGVPVSAPVKPTGGRRLATAGGARRAHGIPRRLRGTGRGVGRVRVVDDRRRTEGGPESVGDLRGGSGVGLGSRRWRTELNRPIAD